MYIEAIKVVKSAKSPTPKEYRYLLIPTEPKYTVRTKNVVSVLPCIVEAKRPMYESAPYVLIKSVEIPRAAPPEKGRIIARGSISGGILK